MQMNQKQRGMLRGILLSTVLFAAAVFIRKSGMRGRIELFGRVLPLNLVLTAAVFLSAYLFVGLPVLRKAFYNIRKGRYSMRIS